MEEMRKKIVLSEVYYWKQTQLLPEHYCDYLIALYTEGETGQSEKEDSKSSLNVKLPFLIFLIVPIFVFMFLSLQVKVEYFLLFCLLLSGMLIFRLIRKPSYHLFLIVSALLLLSVTIEVWEMWLHNSLALLALLASHCIFWLWIGKRYKILYFKSAGIIGFILLFLIAVLNV